MKAFQLWWLYEKLFTSFFYFVLVFIFLSFSFFKNCYWAKLLFRFHSNIIYCTDGPIPNQVFITKSNSLPVTGGSKSKTSSGELQAI